MALTLERRPSLESGTCSSILQSTSCLKTFSSKTTVKMSKWAKGSPHSSDIECDSLVQLPRLWDDEGVWNRVVARIRPENCLGHDFWNAKYKWSKRHKCCPELCGSCCNIMIIIIMMVQMNLYYISQYLGWEIDDQHRNTYMNDKDHLVGQLTKTNLAGEQWIVSISLLLLPSSSSSSSFVNASSIVWRSSEKSWAVPMVQGDPLWSTNTRWNLAQIHAWLVWG